MSATKTAKKKRTTKTGANMSQQIREYATAHPDQKRPKEVLDGLAAQGVHVSYALVAGVLTRLNKKPVGKRKNAKNARKKLVKAKKGSYTLTVPDLKLGLAFVKELQTNGCSYVDIRSLIDEIEEIRG